MITFEDIQNNEEIKTYITCADESLRALGFTVVVLDSKNLEGIL